MATSNHHLQNGTSSKLTKKKKPHKNPETNLLINLQYCSKSKDLPAAIALYDSAVSDNIRLNHQHFNILLYLCSASEADPSSKSLAVDHGFRFYDRMVSSGITPNEASIAAVARLAASKGDGEYAFKIVKDMVANGGVPRLRTYAPALLCFAESLDADKAYEVEEHMIRTGIILEEAEIAALLKVSAETGRRENVYRYLHKLRDSVRCVSEDTAKIVERWFSVNEGSDGSGLDCDVGLIRAAVSSNGGGWHGLGWLGNGKWTVRRCNIDPTGKCCCCMDQLACVDIDDAETQKFANSIAGLAMEREVKANFSNFQDWLEKHSGYEAIVDGANIGLYQQNFADGGFSIPQLDAVVKELYNESGNKWPLIILHGKRVRVLLENPSSREMVREWIDKDVLYTTPPGSNDDWYWLYAAVKLKCLLVTNDEMRDHIFELIGSNFFLKWKERHQVRYTFPKGNLKLQMPPLYSLVIQESEKGSWHVPISNDTTNNQLGETWLCISRHNVCDSELQLNLEQHENGHDHKLSNQCDHRGINSFPNVDNKTTSIVGNKRKEMSTDDDHHLQQK